jgi:hypothetical protein
MNLAIFRANGAFSQRMLEHFRESQWSDSDNTGTAMLFEAASARAGRLSSAAAENAKELWR